jgi:2-phosphoglycerate kinase
MAKLQVYDISESANVPFMRGILISSLREAGLTIDQAQDLTSKIREQLSHRVEIDTNELHQTVADLVGKEFGPEAQSRYIHPQISEQVLQVIDEEGQQAPFSHDQLIHSLECCGLPRADAIQTTNELYRLLLSTQRHAIKSGELGHITHTHLKQTLGEDAAERYLVWTDFVHSGQPLLILIGGAPGSGKSTIANSLANRLNIVRTQSTDMLREVMRMMLPKNLLPVLHTSSFNVSSVMTEFTRHQPGELLITGYQRQSELLRVPCEAVVNRAVNERVSMVLEGVHVDPFLMKLLDDVGDLITIPVMLGVLKPKTLRNHIRGRASQASHRRAERYLEHFNSIWQLQSYLLSEADNEGIPIITNNDKDKAIREIMTIILDTLAERKKPTLEGVFGPKEPNAS